MHVLVPCLSKNLHPRPSKKIEIASAVKSREGNLLADQGRRAAVWFMLPDSGFRLYLPLLSREWRNGVQLKHIKTTITTILPFPTNQR